MLELKGQRNHEKVLVLLEFDMYSPATILRGAKVAQAFGCDFEVLFLHEAENTHHDAPEVELMNTESKKLSEDLGVNHFQVKEFPTYNKAFKYLVAYIKEGHFTQLVLTHVAESRFEEMLHGSFPNLLMKEMPQVDLHFVSQNLAFPYEHWNYDRGLYAYLDRTETDGEFIVTFEKSEQTVEDGVFFKESATDFDNGIFMSFTNGKKFDSYHVHGLKAKLLDEENS